MLFRSKIVNAGSDSFDMDLYRITSASGALDPAGWNSLEDQDLNGDGIPNNGIGWETLGTTTEALSEVIFAGADGNDFSTVAPGDKLNLGRAFAGDETDVVFAYHRAGTQPGNFVPGLISYVTGVSCSATSIWTAWLTASTSTPSSTSS